MTTKVRQDNRVDEYISSAPDFAKPILLHLRQLVHSACPDVQETMKWSRPHFLHNGMLCGMSAFKHHCAFGFWKADLVFSAAGGAPPEKAGAGNFGPITSLADLPSDEQMLAFIRKAVEVNDSGTKRPVSAAKPANRELVVPDYFTAAPGKSKKARTAFAAFSHSHKKEYVEWIADAKREQTRQKRIETTLQWLAGGKSRHWKYAGC